MAKTGFLYTCAAKRQEDGTYKEGRYLGKSAAFNVTPTSSDVKDYGDNGVAETDTSVTGGTIALEINEMLNELNAFLLGHSLDEKTGEVVFNQDDIAPMLGIGAVGTSKRNGKHKYTAKMYHQVQFKEPNDENSTKQENTSFVHTNLEGNLFVPEDGDWKAQNEFDTLDEAKAWLNEKLGITVETGTETDENEEETGA